MLYDPNWKPAIAPAEIPAIEPWRQILLDAADVIQRQGWVRNDFHNGEGVCAIGAFRVVQHGNGEKRHSRHPKYDAADLKRAKRRFWTTIPQDEKRTDFGAPLKYCSLNIQEWNDYHCSSKTEIIRYLKKAAKGE